MNELAIKFCLRNHWITGQDPQGWESTWIQNLCNDLYSFGMELPEAREAAQDQPFWQTLTKHNTTHI